MPVVCLSVCLSVWKCEISATHMSYQQLKSKGIHVLNYVQRHEDVWGSEGITPSIFDLNSRLIRVIRFTTHPSYFWGKWPYEHRVGGWREMVWTLRGRCNTLSWLELWFPGRRSHSLVRGQWAIATHHYEVGFNFVFRLNTQTQTVSEAQTVLGRFRKISKSDYQLRHVCLSVRIKLLVSHWVNFHEIWYLRIFSEKKNL